MSPSLEARSRRAPRPVAARLDGGPRRGVPVGPRARSSSREVGAALETQGLSMLRPPGFEAAVGSGDDDAARGLAQMVRRQRRALPSWSDLWLNEGHASWYEFVYSEEQGFLADDTVDYPDPEGYDTVDELMHAVYRAQRPVAPRLGPVAAPDRLRPPVRPAGLPRRRARPVRAAPGGGRAHVRAHRARVGGALPRPRGDDGGLHRARLAGLAAATCAASCARGSTAPRPRRCPGTRTGRPTR